MTDPVATRATAWVIGSWDAHGNRPRLVSVALKKEGSRKNSIILIDTIWLTSRNLLEFPNPQAGDLVRRLPKRTGACPAGRQPYRSLREGSVCAPWQGSRPAVAFPLQTTSAKGTERHHTVADTRWLAGGGRGPGTLLPEQEAGGTETTPGMESGSIEWPRPYSIGPPVRGWRAAGCVRMGNLGFSLPVRGVRGRPNGEHRSSHVRADLSRRRTDLPIPLSSRTLSTQTACGHHVIHANLVRCATSLPPRGGIR